MVIVSPQECIVLTRLSLFFLHLVAVSTSLDSQIRIWDLEQLKQHKIIDAGAGKDPLHCQVLIGVLIVNVQEHWTY